MKIWLLLLIPTALYAQEESICRVSCVAPVITGHGTGTLLFTTKSNDFVLSCKHIIEPNSRIYCRFLQTDKESFKCDKYRYSPYDDLALFRIGNTGLAPYKLANKPPVFKTQLIYGGYGSVANKFQLFKGQYYFNTLNKGKTLASGVTNKPWRSGDSGGPVLHNNKLVGVGWGSTKTDMYFTQLSAINRFLNTNKDFIK